MNVVGLIYLLFFVFYVILLKKCYEMFGNLYRVVLVYYIDVGYDFVVFDVVGVEKMWVGEG